jgi:Concanavalin A-like lectin/glucanases superfamily
MLRRLALVMLLGACGFRSSASPAGAGSEEPVSDVDAAIDGTSSVNPTPYCDPTDPNLMACYQFEGNTNDGSTHHLDTTMKNVSFPPGKVGKAMQFKDDSAADVNDSQVFDVTALTIEAWINPSQMPTRGDTANILDVNNQYSFQLHDNGDLECKLIGGKSLTAPAHVAMNQWTHVACTYDSATGSSAIYVNGATSMTDTGGGTLKTDGDSGLSLSADNAPPQQSIVIITPPPPPPPSRQRLIGLLDEVRLMSIARTQAQICADTGKSSCP